MALSIDRLKNPYIWAYSAALVLHLLLLFLKEPLTQALLIPAQHDDPVAQNPPLVFEFVDVPEVVPSDQKPDATPLVADRDLISRDETTQPLPESHLAFIEGLSLSKDVAPTAPGKYRKDFETGQQTESQLQEEMRDTKAQKEETFSFADVLQRDPDQAQKERERAVLGGVSLPRQHVQLDNKQTRALERGGLQLSTYAWNFAPYLAYLKQHIGNHIYPPRAFELGLLEGTTRVKFRIFRDGRLEGPQMVDTKGSAILAETSMKAVDLSAPFKALPSDFPDEYLDIVGTFEYLIIRKSRGQ